MGGFVLFNSSKNPVDNSVFFEKEINKNTAKTLAKTLEMDTDKDGLKDWEESLWKTDPNNPDTDGDGTTDGEEVKTNRNPLIKGLGDKNSEQQKTTPSSNTKYEEPDTITGAMTEELFSRYFKLKTKGKLTDETKKELISSVADNIDIKNNYRTYTIDDLTVIDNSINSFKKYGNVFADILLEYIKNINPENNEVVIMTKAIKTENVNLFKKLSPAITNYKELAKKLLNIKVPKDAAGIHLNIVNNYESIASALEDVKKYPDDPILGFIGISKYTQYINQLNISANDLSEMFIKNKVPFTEKDPGLQLIVKNN